MNATVRPVLAWPNEDVPAARGLAFRGGTDTHFHGEYTNTTKASGTDRGIVARECLASPSSAVMWLLDNALDHPKTLTIRINSRGQQHWFELATRPHTKQSTRARERTRRHMTDVIRPAVARGDVVRAEVTISSAVRPRILTVTPHPNPCPHHPSTTSIGRHQAAS